MKSKRILHIAKGTINAKAWPDVMIRAVRELGDFEWIEQGGEMEEDALAARIRQSHVLVTGWGSVDIPESVAADRGNLEYVCNLTGSVRSFIPLSIIEAGIPVTNWGDAIAIQVAEGAMALLLAVLKDLRSHIRLIREGGWKMDEEQFGGSLEGTPVGIYGCGVIARAFIRMIQPYRPVLRVFDPYVADLPEGCERADSLEDLFDRSRILVVHAGLSDETRGSITADLLARLPRHGVVINTARGGIFEQEALFRELESGRLRAGLDVLEPDFLPPDHPARQWDNVILTAHQVGGPRACWPTGGGPQTELNPFQKVCIENLRRHFSGEPLQFRMDRDRYLRST
ncbi:MAG: NAD(P)-dependent oxidoreductase [Kiritimatiellia bacterium]|nr:NAD(P)-dependent oxidoreductase [Kiritimatiellia bacterium]